MHLAPEAQRREKLNMLDDALSRIGGNPQRPAKTVFVSEGEGLAYRSRVRLRVDKQGHVGYLSPRSNRLVPIDRCAVAVPLINDAIASLTRLDEAAQKRLTFCDQLELRAVDLEPRLSVRLFPRKGVKLRAELYAPLFPQGTLVAVADSTDDKQLVQQLQVTAQVTLRVPMAAFSQVHLGINRRLVAAVVEAATLRNLKSFVDAYAGAGNFALPLLAAGLVGEAIDQGDAGILAARSVARELGLPFAGFSIGDAKRLLEQFIKNKRQFDYVVLDPPRSGSKEVLELALRLKPRYLALIGCDPVALARDLGALVAKGCTIESLTVFDMFPETHHSEALAIVEAPLV
jgi:23S rRNA (uracil1939-C5)-methyltransferase